MTIEQVKEDIKDGKCEMIYYSSSTLWWTHLTSDVEEAMKTGKAASDKRHEDMMNDPNFPQENKDKLKALKKMIGEGAVEIPMDPTGAPLMQISEKKDIEGWVAASEAKPEHFGKHGVDAFMKSHHQNCDNNCFKEWAGYNEMIDNV